MSTQILSPYPLFTSLIGVPLTLGYVYIGEANQDPETHPQATFWDEGLSTPATQPLRTNGGYIVNAGNAATAYTADAYSIRVRDKNGVQVFFRASVPAEDPAASLVLAEDGSANDPSIAFAADPDTGFYRSASGTITYVGNGQVVWSSGPTTFGIGTGPGSSRLTIQTERTFTANGEDLYHYADQTNAANATIARADHIYNDGQGHVIDVVGSGTAQVLRQARNPAARSDKPSTYVGTGMFRDHQRTTTTGTGGNLGNGNNRLLYTDAQGCTISLGIDATEWSGSFGNAPRQFRPLSGAAIGGYLGWHTSGQYFVVGSIEDGVGFKPLQLAASEVQLVSDAAVDLGTSSHRARNTYSSQFRPGSGAPIWTSGSGTPEGAVTAPVGSLYTRTDGGAITTLYVKETGSGNTGWVAK